MTSYSIDVRTDCSVLVNKYVRNKHIAFRRCLLGYRYTVRRHNVSLASAVRVPLFCFYRVTSYGVSITEQTTTKSCYLFVKLLAKFPAFNANLRKWIYIYFYRVC